MQPLPAAPHDGDEAGLDEDVEMLRRRLAGHLKALAQLAEGLAVALTQPVEQQPPCRVGQRLEDLVHRCRFGTHASIMQVITCIMSSAARPAAYQTNCCPPSMSYVAPVSAVLTIR